MLRLPPGPVPQSQLNVAVTAPIRETLKNDPISLFPPLESVIFDLAARFNPFLGSFWVF